MYTSYTGRKFLALYNERTGAGLSAEEFFDREFFPLFFEDERHLMHVGNSPFFQKPRDEDVRKHGSRAKAQFANLKKKVAGDAPDMSFFVGSAAAGVGATTSGQVCIEPPVDSEEIYASWMGEALGIGVSGGLVMLVDEPEVLWALCEGWKYYRRYLNQTPNIKDKQIETWNGQWLCLWADPKFDPEHPLDRLNPDKITGLGVGGNMAIKTVEWSEVVLSLARKYPDRVMTVCAYNLSQTNTTLGFINLYLPEVRKMWELRDELLEPSDSLENDEMSALFDTFYNFRAACRLGAIGLKALEPDKLRDYMPVKSAMYAKGKEYKFGTEKARINYELYKTWIMAMLNKKELLGLATRLAGALIEFEGQATRGKAGHAQLVKETLEAYNAKAFIAKLTDVMESAPEHAETFREVMVEAHEMPADKMPLFVTLIRFEYVYLKTKKQ